MAICFLDVSFWRKVKYDLCYLNSMRQNQHLGPYASLPKGE